jgi:hypothetical protein
MILLPQCSSVSLVCKYCKIVTVFIVKIMKLTANIIMTWFNTPFWIYPWSFICTCIYFGLLSLFVSNQIKCIYIDIITSADIPKCCTETQPKTPNSKQCRCRSTVARKNSLERPEPRKKPREEPGSEGWPVLIWLCRVEIITITVVVEGAKGQHLRSKCQLAFHSQSLRVSLPLLLSPAVFICMREVLTRWHRLCW